MSMHKPGEHMHCAQMHVHYCTIAWDYADLVQKKKENKNF